MSLGMRVIVQLVQERASWREAFCFCSLRDKFRVFWGFGFGCSFLWMVFSSTLSVWDGLKGIGLVVCVGARG